MNPREAFIVSNKNHLDRVFGKPKTPMQVAQRISDLGRHLGKTRTLIEALPDDGMAIIMVHKMSYANDLRQEIVDVRGRDYPVKELKFTTLDLWSEDNHLRGLSPRPAFIDNAVYDQMALDLAQRFYGWFSPPKRRVESPTEIVKRITGEEECLPLTESTITSTPGSGKTSKRSRTKSKRNATNTDTPSQS